ncbi:MAG: hypothetical protein WAO23_00300 [Dethiobacteria bacterium]
MPIPCKANCKNQKNGFCKLEDDRLVNSKLEFGADWDPMSNCACFESREKQKKKNKKTKK